MYNNEFWKTTYTEGLRSGGFQEDLFPEMEIKINYVRIVFKGGLWW
jgi:hypothetical protein